MQQAEIPKRHRKDVTFSGDKLRVFEGLKAAMRQGSVFALIGSRGGGKTQVAVEVVKYQLAAKRVCLYAKAMGFFTDLKESYRKDSKISEGGVIAKYCLPGLLVLDEIQERGETDWENRQFTHLLDKRYDAMCDTILIGNIAREQLHENVGASIASRMQEAGGIIECNWPSFRENAA